MGVWSTDRKKPVKGALFPACGWESVDTQGDHHEKGSALNRRQVQRAQGHLRIYPPGVNFSTPAWSLPLPVLLREARKRPEASGQGEEGKQNTFSCSLQRTWLWEKGGGLSLK